ncbi:hypothetical protein LR48_Vigan10g227700 [Vigna angularis]|uniref:Uncharacterized protein n=1 Tax=Phaseolus angularis TaxID=3914 RepID=A0A0L9VMV4_PHAAN|nr:hypothetical protein LR48_Vigan10g227700 [Vigna angularis]
MQLRATKKCICVLEFCVRSEDEVEAIFIFEFWCGCCRLKVFTVMKKKTVVNGRGRTWLTMTTELKRGCVFGYKEWRNRFDDEEELHSGAYSVTREA